MGASDPLHATEEPVIAAHGRRLALISSSYAPYVGGVEEHVHHVARELQHRGHVVVVWTVDRGEHLGVREVDGVTVRYLSTPLPARSLGAVLRFLWAMPRAVWLWGRAYVSDRPELLHVQCFGPNGLYAAGLARLARRPLVVSSHGETFTEDHDAFEKSRLLRSGLRAALGQAAAVTGCSRMVLDDLRNRFGGPAGDVVPNGVTLEAAASDADWEGGGSPSVLAIGRLEHVKGFDLLVRAFARLDAPAETRLVIGGDGSRLDSLREQARAAGLDRRVDFRGRLTREDVARAMAQSAVVVVPSRLEAFGIVVLEAWRAQTPVVVTARGGPAELVTDGVDGLVVDPEDVDAMAGAIGRVLVDPVLAARLVEGGRRAVVHYTWSRPAAAYEHIYASCCSS